MPLVEDQSLYRNRARDVPGDFARVNVIMIVRPFTVVWGADRFLIMPSDDFETKKKP
jgi:hypothetical protein